MMKHLTVTFFLLYWAGWAAPETPGLIDAAGRSAFPGIHYVF